MDPATLQLIFAGVGLVVGWIGRHWGLLAPTPAAPVKPPGGAGGGQLPGSILDLIAAAVLQALQQRQAQGGAAAADQPPALLQAVPIVGELHIRSAASQLPQ